MAIAKRTGVAVVLMVCVTVLFAGSARCDVTAKVPKVSGCWHTSFVDLYIEQDGSKVKGFYNFKGGRFEGTITGNRLDYAWTQADGKKGGGYFTISADARSLDGRYWYNADQKSGGLWTGRSVKALAEEVKRCNQKP